NFCLGIKKCSNAAFKFKMPNIPDFSIEVGLFGVQVLCYGALTLRHTKISQTLDVYGHLAKETKEKTVEKLVKHLNF
ncbi:hypothetical protein, partial [Enterococcus italicus]